MLPGFHELRSLKSRAVEDRALLRWKITGWYLFFSFEMEGKVPAFNLD